MSELVEKVRDAIFKAYDFNCIATEKMSSAAIAAVAARLESQGQFDGDGKGVVAAALRAAAGGGEK